MDDVERTSLALSVVVDTILRELAALRECGYVPAFHYSQLYSPDNQSPVARGTRGSNCTKNAQKSRFFDRFQENVPV